MTRAIALLQRLRESGSARDMESRPGLLRDYNCTVARRKPQSRSAPGPAPHLPIDSHPGQPDQLPSAAELAILSDPVAVLEMESGQELRLRLDECARR